MEKVKVTLFECVMWFVDTVDEANLPEVETSTSFATLGNHSNNSTIPTERKPCLCGDVHPKKISWGNCYYVNPSAAPAGFAPIKKKQDLVAVAIKRNPRIKKAISHAIKRWEI
jgi:hypothetical protein